jgi:hypothetical protein
MNSASLVLLLHLLFSMVGAAYGQVKDVPNYDRAGDFRSTRVPGNRGPYQHLLWLVIDRDPKGLNCRDFRGSVVASLTYGTVVRTSVNTINDDGIRLIDGEAWLKVTASPGDPRQRYVCYIRANAAYIAPINPDTLSIE